LKYYAWCWQRNSCGAPTHRGGCLEAKRRSRGETRWRVFCWRKFGFKYKSTIKRFIDGKDCLRSNWISSSFLLPGFWTSTIYLSSRCRSECYREGARVSARCAGEIRYGWRKIRTKFSELDFCKSRPKNVKIGPKSSIFLQHRKICVTR